jgi:hypothetical protein
MNFILSCTTKYIGEVLFFFSLRNHSGPIVVNTSKGKFAVQKKKHTTQVCFQLFNLPLPNVRDLDLSGKILALLIQQ